MNRAKYLELLNNAIELVAKKDQDYNSKVKLEEYFPFGDISYVQMMHVKLLRIRNLLESGQAPNYEGIKDSVYDLINYAVFYLEHMEKIDGIRDNVQTIR